MCLKFLDFNIIFYSHLIFELSNKIKYFFICFYYLTCWWY